MKLTLQALGELELTASTSSALATLSSSDTSQTLTVDATAGGVQLSAFSADTTQVYVSVQDQAVRVTFDGSAPTTSHGHTLEVGYQELWSKDLATAAKFIRDNGTDGQVHASPLK